MSIILKKKKGLLTPKSHAPKPSQIFGNLGTGSILGVSLSKELAIDTIIEESIQRLIMEKMLLHSTRQVRGFDYFASYCLMNGEKEVKSLFLKRRAWKNFIAIERGEMIASGAMPEEFIKFLRKKRCRKVKIDREQLENNI
jgi:hypothetical protein